MPKGYATTYIDGSLPGGTWDGAAHASASTRSAQSRAGGRWYDLYDDYSVGVVGMLGFGMPGLKHNVTPYSLLPGALLQSIKTEPRQFTLILEPAGGSLSTLHTQRDSLIDAFKPDLVTPLQPVRLKYSGATNEVEIAAYYAGGLEGSIGGDEGVKERMAVRFVAYDPYFTLGRETSATLDSQDTVSTDYIVKRVDGTWAGFPSAPNEKVRALTEGPNKTIYVGGHFTNLGDANGDYIAKYTPSSNAWSSMGTGLQSFAYDIVLSASGQVYVCGEFTSAGGVANTSRIARWDGSAWNALGTGANGITTSMAIDRSGNLYATGEFTLMGGVADTAYVAKWDGSAWTALSTGLGNAGRDVVIGLDGSVYICGAFTNLGDANGDYVIKWNGSAWSSLGTGLNAEAYAMAVGLDGTLYVGGTFTSAGGVANTTYIASWNGTSWQALGTGVNGNVRRLYVDSSGLLHAIGDFTTAGGLSLAVGAYDIKYAIWNGSSWVYPDMYFSGTPALWGITGNSEGDLYLGYDNTSNVLASGHTTVTNNGSATAYPKLAVKLVTAGTANTLRWLKNETTGATCWFNYALQDGETITIDFTPGNKTITSDFRGNVIGAALLPGSDFSTWSLLPGSNDVSLLVSDTGSATITALLTWHEQFWSPDGAN